MEELLKNKVFNKTADLVDPHFKQMGEVFEYLKAMDRIEKVSFDMSLARGLDYYTGLIY